MFGGLSAFWWKTAWECWRNTQSWKINWPQGGRQAALAVLWLSIDLSSPCALGARHPCLWAASPGPSTWDFSGECQCFPSGLKQLDVFSIVCYWMLFGERGQLTHGEKEVKIKRKHTCKESCRRLVWDYHALNQASILKVEGSALWKQMSAVIRRPHLSLLAWQLPKCLKGGYILPSFVSHSRWSKWLVGSRRQRGKPDMG